MTVKVDSSDWENVLSVVLQGSVMGLLLIILLMTTLVLSKVCCSCLQNNYHIIEKCDIVQNALYDGNSWADDKWEPKFHFYKCGVMHFEREKKQTIVTK